MEESHCQDFRNCLTADSGSARFTGQFTGQFLLPDHGLGCSIEGLPEYLTRLLNK